jgi:acyl-CoA synthetase (AMP-forming)/AMP-acid ligase II
MSDPASAPPAEANLARHVARLAASHPGLAALKIPRGRTPEGKIDYLTLTFAELEAEVAAWSARLAAAGVGRGDRTLVMVRQGLPLIASVFALFRIGAVPVVIDPGMGLGSFLACVARSRPRALVGIPLARLLSRIFRGSFRSVEVRVAAEGALTARLSGVTGPRVAAPPPVACAPEELAAILFTSGSTGAPKGVCYEHGMFEAQVRLIRETYGIELGEIDLPLLPIFALFNPALGMTTIVPEIDPRRPGALDPARIIQAIRQEGVTNSFGSPTLWRKLAAHGRKKGIALPSLRRVLCAGAAVPADLWEQSREFLPHGRLHSPYGATEALPVATIAADEAAAVSGWGACVGRPVPGVDVRIIAPTDGPLGSRAEARELAAGEIGEIIVRGLAVTKAYDALPEATARAKIPDAGGIWHRMGDCGYRDAAGRLWFCGRRAERVETSAGVLYSEPCEQVFRVHPAARRCALVGLGEPGRQVPALVVESDEREAGRRRQLAAELAALGRAHPHTAGITRFFFRSRLPVDVRHNAKIHRLTLARWAAREAPTEVVAQP